jgi:hypothetical protein
VKIKDIEIGKEYVYGRSTWARNPDKVLILAKNFPDPSGRTKWDYTVQQDVPVVCALWGRVSHGYNNHGTSREREVTPSGVVELWAEYELRTATERESEQREQDEALARLRERAGPAEAAMESIAAVLGTEYTVHHGVERGFAMVTLRESDLIALSAYVKACREAGFAP